MADSSQPLKPQIQTNFFGHHLCEGQLHRVKTNKRKRPFPSADAVFSTQQGSRGSCSPTGGKKLKHIRMHRSLRWNDLVTGMRLHPPFHHPVFRSHSQIPNSNHRVRIQSLSLATAGSRWGGQAECPTLLQLQAQGLVCSRSFTYVITSNPHDSL